MYVGVIAGKCRSRPCRTFRNRDCSKLLHTPPLPPPPPADRQLVASGELDACRRSRAAILLTSIMTARACLLDALQRQQASTAHRTTQAAPSGVAGVPFIAGPCPLLAALAGRVEVCFGRGKGSGVKSSRTPLDLVFTVLPGRLMGLMSRCQPPERVRPGLAWPGPVSLYFGTN